MAKSAMPPHPFEHALEFGERQVRRLIAQHPGFYPLYTDHGLWHHGQPAWTRWCDGFLPGMMWIFAARHGLATAEGRWWRDQAVRYTTALEPRKLDRTVHDLGFLFMSTYYRWQRLEPAPERDQVLIQAARTLALRFREKGEYLHSFLSPESLFIDIMMNVGLIFYAAQRTGDAELLRIATRHSETTRRVLVRADGSTAHEGIFDLETGRFLRQSTQQGYRADSCWSRGLAWALYGFGTAYRYTQAPEFLATAEACARYYLAHCDGVPPWDFDAPPKSRELIDTSAAAIAAAGLLQLSPAYASDARRIVTTLATRYLAEPDPAWEGILKGGVYHLHKNLGVNESVMWGDYFFLEALESALTPPAPAAGSQTP
jgi:unsaturated chondroitin disaccharide hydrolase